MKLLVGLGNPGKKYAKSRHNLGFMFLDCLREKWEFEPFHLETVFQAEISKGDFLGEKFLLVKPQTFMNLSGEAVQSLKHYYKIDFQDICVIYDDIDLPFGTIRLRERGSAGTHNGLKSVVQVFGNENFSRLRIGIHNAFLDHERSDISDFVLCDFSSDEKKALPKIFFRGIDALEHAFSQGFDSAMTHFNF
ncbi:aminoacyl-tRNA hydrolase [Candidatus Peregrinibacteria bacterium]|nr:aminoacyl-tRNA hydrolase [Candidatus Peregrinibacteria bacterium]